jgi:hypothetical protein
VLLRRTLCVAWLAILLGFSIEAVMLAAAAGFGGLLRVRPLLADLADKVAWSFVVCVGLGFGTATTRSRTATMGLLGLLAAPTAFVLARALHKAASAALGVAAIGVAGPAPLLLAGIKALQYALFGMAVGWLSRRTDAGVRAYVLTGLAAGVVFGGLVLALTARAAPLSPVSLLVRGLHEVLFPVGCALVIWASGVLTRGGDRAPTG